MTANPMTAALNALLAHSDADLKHAAATNVWTYLMVERGSAGDIAVAEREMANAYAVKLATWEDYQRASHEMHAYAVSNTAPRSVKGNTSPRYAPPVEDDE